MSYNDRFWSIKRKRKFKRISSQLRKNFTKRKAIFWIVTLAVVIWIVWYITLQYTFLSASHKINSLSYSQETMRQYNNPYIFKDIDTAFIWKNFYVAKYIQYGELLSEIQQKYPIVASLDLDTAQNGFVMNINFIQPHIVFQQWIREVWIYNGYEFDIFSGSDIASGIVKIKLPEFTSWYQDLSGIFYKVSEERLVFQMEKLHEFFGTENLKSITYIPWWEKTIISLQDNKEVVIANDKEISKQLEKYLMLKEHYQSQWALIKQIDLWSLEDIFIVSNENFINSK